MNEISRTFDEQIKQVYFDDIREKKSIKNSASKKNRTGRGPIRFHHDYLTKKELEAMNGECKTYDMKHFYTWQEFKSMPEHIQTEYLNYIINKYACSVQDISDLVFGRTKTCLYTFLSDHPDIKKYINFPGKGHCTKNTDRARLQNDIRNQRDAQVTMSEPEKVVSPTEPADFTPEEKSLISKYLAPISEEKKTEIEETVKEIIENPDVSETSEPIPLLKHAAFDMDGLDISFLQGIVKQFGDQKIHVRISIDAEKEM